MNKSMVPYKQYHETYRGTAVTQTFCVRVSDASLHSDSDVR